MNDICKTPELIVSFVPNSYGPLSRLTIVVTPSIVQAYRVRIPFPPQAITIEGEKDILALRDFLLEKYPVKITE